MNQSLALVNTAMNFTVRKQAGSILANLATTEIWRAMHKSRAPGCHGH